MNEVEALDAGIQAEEEDEMAACRCETTPRSLPASARPPLRLMEAMTMRTLIMLVERYVRT